MRPRQVVLGVCCLVLLGALLPAPALSATTASDPYEPNDEPFGAPTLEEGTYDDPRINGSDTDYYAVELDANEQVIVSTGNASGDLILELYRSDGTSRVARGGVPDESDETVRHTAPDGGTFYVKVTQFDDVATGYSLSVATRNRSDRFEDNDAAATAAPVAKGAYTGLQLAGAELDYYAVELNASERLTASLSGASKDMILRFYDTDGTTELAAGAEPDVADESFRYTVEEAGTYYVAVDSFPDASTEYALRLAGEDLADRFEPNDEPATAARVGTGGWNGLYITRGERDYYGVALERGQSVTFAANSGIDISTAALAPDGETQVAVSGDPNDGSESLSFVANETGVHYLEVEEHVGRSATYSFQVRSNRTIPTPEPTPTPAPGATPTPTAAATPTATTTPAPTPTATPTGTPTATPTPAATPTATPTPTDTPVPGAGSEGAGGADGDAGRAAVSTPSAGGGSPPGVLTTLTDALPVPLPVAVASVGLLLAAGAVARVRGDDDGTDTDGDGADGGGAGGDGGPTDSGHADDSSGDGGDGSGGDAIGRGGGTAGGTGGDTDIPRSGPTPGGGVDIPSSVPGAPTIDLSYDDLTLGEQVGAGGNADVYRATTPDGVTVALKAPKLAGTMETQSTESWEGFAREADTWARLDDDRRVVGVVDWDEQPMPWLALEFMNGGPLRRHLDEGDWSLERACWTAAEIAQGVKHAHSNGVRHLDLKPENVLFRGTDGWPAPKIGDWGLARLGLASQSSEVGRTTLYAAPEQFEPDRFGEPDDRTDVYQLGTVVYELLAGRRPFEGGTHEVINHVLNDEPVPVAERNPHVPRGLNDAVMRALEREKADRDDSVVYLRDELRETLDDLR